MLNTQIGAKKSFTGQYQVDCSKVPDLPELSFYFGGKAYPLRGPDYILEVQGTCISSFSGKDINLPDGSLWIVGVSPCTTLPQTIESDFTLQVMFSFVDITPFSICPVVLLVSPRQPDDHFPFFSAVSSFYETVDVHAPVVYTKCSSGMTSELSARAIFQRLAADGALGPIAWCEGGVVVRTLSPEVIRNIIHLLLAE